MAVGHNMRRETWRIDDSLITNKITIGMARLSAWKHSFVSAIPSLCSIEVEKEACSVDKSVCII